MNEKTDPGGKPEVLLRERWSDGRPKAECVRHPDGTLVYTHCDAEGRRATKITEGPTGRWVCAYYDKDGQEMLEITRRPDGRYSVKSPTGRWPVIE